MTSRIEIWNSDLSASIGTVQLIAGGTEITIDDPMSEVGLMTFDVGLDDPLILDVKHRNHARLYIEDQLAFTARIEAPLKSQYLTLGGVAKQVRTVNSRGWAAGGDDAPIQPHGGVGGKPATTSRPMSAGSPESDISSAPWFPAIVLWNEISVYDAAYGDDPPWFVPWYPPRGWPDKLSQWLSCRTYDIHDPDQVPHPVDSFHAIKDVFVETAGLKQLWVAADDTFDLEVDGINVGSGAQEPGDSFVTPWAGCWNFSVGWHRIHLTIKNFARPVDSSPVGPFGRPNRGTFAFAMYDLPNGSTTELIPDLVLARSDTSWVVTEYGVTPPAPTWGVIARVFLEEVQAQGLHVGKVLSCTDTHASNGDVWDSNGDQIFAVDQDTYLSVLRTGASNCCIDWHQNPDGITYDINNFGTSTNVDPELIVQDLTETTLPECNSLQVRFKDGVKIVEDSGSITGIGERIRKSISLADLDEAAATAQAMAILAERSIPTSSWTVEIEVDPGTANAPYGAGGWGVGDAPLIDGLRLPTVRMQTTLDAGGHPTFRPELNTRLQSLAERQEVWLSKGAPGSLSGTSRAATPLEGMDAGITAGFIQLESDAPDYVFVVPTSESPYNLTPPWSPKDYPVRIGRIDMEMTTANSTNPLSVDVIRNTAGGSPEVMCTLTLAVGKVHQTVIPGHGLDEPFNVDPNLQSVQLLVTSCDPDTGDGDADARYASMRVDCVMAVPQAVQPGSSDVPWN